MCVTVRADGREEAGSWPALRGREQRAEDMLIWKDLIYLEIIGDRARLHRSRLAMPGEAKILTEVPCSIEIIMSRPRSVAQG